MINLHRSSLLIIDALDSCEKFSTLTVPSCTNIQPIQIETQGIYKLSSELEPLAQMAHQQDY